MKLSRKKLEAMAQVHYETLNNAILGEWALIDRAAKNKMFEALACALDLLPEGDVPQEMEDEINEVIQDAICDGEGDIRAKNLIQNLERRGIHLVYIAEAKAGTEEEALLALAKDICAPLEGLCSLDPKKCSCLAKLFSIAQAHVHKWTPSTLGHGVEQCTKCKMTVMEAHALGLMNRCGQSVSDELTISSRP